MDRIKAGKIALVNQSHRWKRMRLEKILRSQAKKERLMMPSLVQRRGNSMPLLACFILCLGALTLPGTSALPSKGTESDGWQRRPSPGDIILSPLNVASEPGAVDHESITELLRDSPWALVAFKEYPTGRRHAFGFTPRLGRDSDNEIEFDILQEGEKEEELADEEEQRERGKLYVKRTPPFAPRLGRRSTTSPGVIPFIPRMGRRSIRGSSGDEISHVTGNPDRHYLFSPRLGRSTLSAETSINGNAGTTAANKVTKEA